VADWKGTSACAFVAEASDQLDNGDGTYTPYRLGWTAAQTYCQSYGIGAHLLTIRQDPSDGADDQAALGDLLADSGFDNNDAVVWVGLREPDQNTEGAWFWLGATRRLSYGTGGADFSNWNDTSPATGANTADCADVDSFNVNIGDWDDATCTEQHAFICEFPMPQ
jgi:hypothetical protein